MNRTFERHALVASGFFPLAFVCLFGCGGSGSSGLFGNGTSGASGNAGAGGMANIGEGGVSSTGGAGGVAFGGDGTGGGAGGDLAESGGAPPVLDGGRHDAGGVTHDSGSGGAPTGAWARCSTDAECTDGRVCTESAQSFLVSGRIGACVHHCGLTAALCDPPLEAGTVTCTQLLVDSFCTISCGKTAPICPAGMDCVSGNCYYSK